MFTAPISVRPSAFWVWWMSPGIGRIAPWPVAGLNGPAPPPRGGRWSSTRTISWRMTEPS
jgi:hypothetical protein